MSKSWFHSKEGREHETRVIDLGSHEEEQKMNDSFQPHTQKTTTGRSSSEFWVNYEHNTKLSYDLREWSFIMRLYLVEWRK